MRLWDICRVCGWEQDTIEDDGWSSANKCDLNDAIRLWAGWSKFYQAWRAGLIHKKEQARPGETVWLDPASVSPATPSLKWSRFSR